jgi:4-hydroxy-3-polyprenylbenzoate decarboxylase
MKKGGAMHRLKSLREYLDSLRALGEIQEIDAEVDWHLEMGAVIRRACELRAPAPLFTRIKGIERGFRVLGAPAGVSRTHGLARVALSLGHAPDAGASTLVESLAEAHRKPPVPPRRVPDGPCKENKRLGPAVDLWRLPAPLIHDGDGGRYLNTWGTTVVRTPDGRWTNWSISRAMVVGKNTLAGLVLPQQHLGIIFARWRALGRPMPFALALGTEPAIPFVSGMPLDADVAEADFIGGYFGEPVDVVDCETVALQVPATSEIVLEGTVSVNETAPEGPMGEYSGYLSPGGPLPRPVFHVSAVTHRHEPILPVVAAGEPIEENHTCWGLAVSAQLLWELRAQGLPVAMCYSLLQSAAHWLVVTVKPSYRERFTAAQLARALGETLFRSRSGSFIPKVILLEDDVDATDPDEVVWAFATRCHPEHGQVFFPNQAVLPLVAYLGPDERQRARTTKVVYNCLPPDDLPPEQRPRRSSFRHLWPREVQEKVIRDWQKYGYPNP